ncbi:MAG: TetR/AcrR family transcriptional regulator ['Candidatus Kapabacteria' thiocyanatum]|uniref:HTH tetR-type domain-containing protein n=1 Tax=Candidatus Kapaibacterium thiocyanatum TaxID=1895771 RepID=A0A1M3L3K1_9BACT|nr:TetR/AcrR family transcriptional regulator ['Candidatus Kapabacteria' thiocyanatum]OJX59929.1 MAG: hypothetical protein BGO89_07980 ['Candidatus Kapabacteria' thiocyanatum]
MSDTELQVDPRVVRTRRLLLDAFIGLMGEKPFEDISITEIATRATVNRATFYAHFADKQELADAFLREGFERILQKHTAVKGKTMHECLHNLFMATLEHRRTVHADCKAKGRNSNELRVFEASIEVEVKMQLREYIHERLLDDAGKKTSTAKQQADMMAAVISSALYAAVVHISTMPASQSTSHIDVIVDRIARTLDT